MRYAWVVLLLLSGCATWTHPTKGEREFHADQYECERDAVAVRDPWQAMEMRRRCMRVKGWTDSY